MNPAAGLCYQKIKASYLNSPIPIDWGRLQFWYTEATAAAVAQEAIHLADGGPIACVACPSLFRHLQKHHPDVSAHLFEIDMRFEVWLPHPSPRSPGLTQAVDRDRHQFCTLCFAFRSLWFALGRQLHTKTSIVRRSSATVQQFHQLDNPLSASEYCVSPNTVRVSPNRVRVSPNRVLVSVCA